MTIILIGLNHRTAPVEIREQLALSEAGLQDALADLNRQMQADATSHSLREAVILSTCNRLEFYIEAEPVDEAITLMTDYLSDMQPVNGAVLRPHIYSKTGAEAAEHLMRVACGLDSMILGETQILRQVTDAYALAHTANTCGAILSHLFAQAIHTAKRAHTETPIGRHTTSVSHAAALLLREALAGQTGAHILVIGAGEMASLAAQALKRFDLHDLHFMNRTFAHAQTLAAEYGGHARAWDDLRAGLAWADAVITATAAPHPVIPLSTVQAALAQRANRPLVIIDIAVPRDVEAGVRALGQIIYHDIDDLQSIVDGNLELRKAAIPQVETIITQELARFIEWYRARQITPVIRNLREWAQGIADEELDQTLNRLADADERTRQLVSRMAHRLVSRILHEPTARLQVQANEGNVHGYAQAVKELFALDKLEAVECQHDHEHCPPAAQPLPCTLECISPQTGAPPI